MGAYIEDKKRQKSFISIRLTSQMLRSTFLGRRTLGIEYGLVGGVMTPNFTREWTDQWGDWSDYPNSHVDPNFHESRYLPDRPLRIKGWSPTRVLSDKLAWCVGMNISSDIVLISDPATGVAKVVEHLGLKPENVVVLDGLNDLNLLLR